MLATQSSYAVIDTAIGCEVRDPCQRVVEAFLVDHQLRRREQEIVEAVGNGRHAVSVGWHTPCARPRA